MAILVTYADDGRRTRVALACLARVVVHPQASGRVIHAEAYVEDVLPEHELSPKPMRFHWPLHKGNSLLIAYVERVVQTSELDVGLKQSGFT